MTPVPPSVDELEAAVLEAHARVIEAYALPDATVIRAAEEAWDVAITVLAGRARGYEEALRELEAICLDSSHAHRMITRREILDVTRAALGVTG